MPDRSALRPIRADATIDRTSPVTTEHRRPAAHTPGAVDAHRWPSSTPRRSPTIEDLLAKDADDPAEPVRDRRQGRSHVGGAAALAPLRRRRRTGVRAGARRPLAADRRARALGRGSLPRRRPAAGLRAQRRQARRRDRPGPRPVWPPSRSAPDAEGDIWWIGDPRGVGQAHRRGVARTCARASGSPSRSSPTRWCARREAQGLPRCRQSEAQPLAKQSLRFLYRILFLLYAEASPELGVLPAGAPEYEHGYSLDRLRELTLVELATHASQQRHPPLRLARPCSSGWSTRAHAPTRADADGTAIRRRARRSSSLRADLFKPEATALIDEVGLGNAALQQVLRHLLLSKEPGAATAASSPTPSSASTSSARSTRA